MFMNIKIGRNKLAAAFLVLMLAVLFCVSYGVSAEEKIANAAEKSDRLAFLQGFGHTCDGKSEEVKEITIPSEFSQVYINYNALQKLMGYNLENYKGQQATLYTYAVTNYVGGEEVYAHLLVKDGCVIGGDIASLRIDGFMEGFGGERV